MANGHAQGQQQQPEELNIEEYINGVNEKIEDKPTRQHIEELGKMHQYKDLMQAYGKLDKPLAVAWYYVKFAEAEKKVDVYVSAGDYNSMLLQSAPDDKARKFLATNAVTCYKGAVDLDSTNTKNRVRLAGAIMTEGSQPMQGVMTLLDIVKKDSNNIDAQMMLGRFGLISGQIDKAIARFEKVLYLHPQNSEALYSLAQAYDSKGDKKKAVELLEKCKKTMQDPEARKEIDKYIEQIKKP